MTLAEQMAADAAAAPAAAPKLTLAQQMTADAAPARGANPSGIGPKTAAAMAGTPPTDPSLPSWYHPLPEEGTPAEQDRRANNNAFAGNVIQNLTGAGASLIGGYRALATLIAPETMGADPRDSRLTAAVKALEEEQRNRTIMAAPGSDAAKLEPYNPLNIPAKVGGAVGNAINSLPNQVGGVDITAPKATAATVADAGIQVFGVPGLMKAAPRLVAPLSSVLRPSTAVTPRIEPTIEAPAAPALVNDQAAPQPLSLEPQQPVPGRPDPLPADASAPAMPLAPVAAPAAQPRPTISDAANGVFAENNPDIAGGLPPEEQARRAQVLQQIGLDQVRKSAITGDANQAAVDFQTSRLKGSPSGDAMSQQLASEKLTISDYADGIAQRTGGSSLNDQSAKLARGEAILTPLEGLKEWFDNQTSALYKTADERAQGEPTQLDNFRTVLGDDSLATNSDRVNLRTAAGAYAKKLGIIDDQGNVFANAQQAETMRKYLNENWSPQNSGLVGKLKDALDADVMQAAGEDVYGQARALRAQRAQTLDNPNGIAKLLDSSGPQGVNRAVPVEKVADTITNMPVAQLSNIVGTLKNMPPELQPMAADALSEIKAQYAHNVKGIGANQAGQWNAKGVRQYLSNNSARMNAVFSPEEMQQFGTLNDAGNILAKDQSYPGAFAQQHNLIRAGVAHAISSGMTTAGGAIGGPIGGVVGSMIGGNLAGKFSDAATMRATQKRFTKLSDLVPTPPPEATP